MSSYCYDCDKFCSGVSEENQNIIDDDIKFYAHDECSSCGTVFYSPAKPKWAEEGG